MVETGEFFDRKAGPAGFNHPRGNTVLIHLDFRVWRRSASKGSMVENLAVLEDLRDLVSGLTCRDRQFASHSARQEVLALLHRSGNRREEPAKARRSCDEIVSLGNPNGALCRYCPRSLCPAQQRSHMNLRRPTRRSNSLLFRNALESDARMAASLGKAPDFSRLFGGAVDKVRFRTGNFGNQNREF